MAKSPRKKPIPQTPEEEKSYTLVPNTVLGNAAISDRAYRLLCTLIHVKGRPQHDEDDFETGNVISYTRPDYEGFAETMHCTVRVLNAAVREAAAAGLLIVKHAGNEVTLSRGPAL